MLICFSRILLLYVLLINSAFAATYIPQNDNEVLEVVSNSGKLNKLKKLQASLKVNPNNPDLAYLIAKEYVSLGHQESNPRYYSYARSILEPWWDNFHTAPKEIQLLIANIMQFNHDFNGAIKVLNVALKQNPNLVPALLMRAAIYSTTGEHNKSKQDCIEINDNNILLKTTCIALADSMGPNLPQSFNHLEAALLNKHTEDPLWSLIAAAELASRLEKDPQSKIYYRKALNLYPDDIYLLSSYFDYLIKSLSAKPHLLRYASPSPSSLTTQSTPVSRDSQALHLGTFRIDSKHREYQELINLLKNRTQHDNLLLRLAIAEQLQTGTTKYSKELEIRFKAAHLRQDNRHQREEAIYHLEITHNYPQALILAKANFQVQKELIDIETLLKAAKLAKDTKELESIQAYIKNLGLLDKTL